VSSNRDLLANTAQKTLKMMRDSGFEVSERLEVVVDPELPFMGYSRRRKEGGHVIVVSGMALKSGLVEGLLIHEMCHVYRTDTNHPSHNHELLNRVSQAIIHKHQLTEPFQIRIIQQAVNHIQDLYADDIAFQVFQKTKSFTPEQAHKFFLDWIQDTPLGEKSTKERWLNTGILLNNCFATSNLTRHNIPDTDNKAQNKTQKFLSQTNKKTQTGFIHLRNFMTNLKQNPTPKQFEIQLNQYLNKIAELATQT